MSEISLSTSTVAWISQHKHAHMSAMTTERPRPPQVHALFPFSAHTCCRDGTTPMRAGLPFQLRADRFGEDAHHDRLGHRPHERYHPEIRGADPGKGGETPGSLLLKDARGIRRLQRHWLATPTLTSVTGTFGNQPRKLIAPCPRRVHLMRNFAAAPSNDTRRISIFRHICFRKGSGATPFRRRFWRSIMRSSEIC